MATNDMKKLHIVVFPWLAFGHLLPFFKLSKYLATKGHHVSFLSPPKNLHRLPKIPQNLLSLVTLIPLPLPHVPGLPSNSEATTDLHSDKIPLLRIAYHGLQESVARFLQGASPIDWIVHDLNPWIGPIADGLGIKKAFFITTYAWTIAVLAPSPYIKELGDGPGIGPKTQPNNNLLYRIHEAKKSLGNIDEVSEQTGVTIKNSDVIIIRSCVEFEPESMQLLEMLYNKPVVPTGLMPVCQVDNDKEEDTWQVISNWLDKQKKKSVVYVALGSEVSPSQDQITELALGLEVSKLPFLWALRKTAGSLMDLPDGFEERTRGIGLVWTKWAPQTRILAHESIGAFLTHCGCSSVIEGLQFGRPLIMLPFVLDQVLNAKKLEEKNVGVEIVKDEKDGSICRRKISELVKLMLKDEGGNVYREEAMKMSRIVGDKGLHSQYFEKMEAYLRNN